MLKYSSSSGGGGTTQHNTWGPPRAKRGPGAGLRQLFRKDARAPGKSEKADPAHIAGCQVVSVSGGERPDLRFPNRVGENCPLAARRLFRLALSLNHNCPLARERPPGTCSVYPTRQAGYQVVSVSGGERPDLRFPNRVGENCPLAARRLFRLALSLNHNCPLARPDPRHHAAPTTDP
jgi:hypothetical protein